MPVTLLDILKDILPKTVPVLYDEECDILWFAALQWREFQDLEDFDIQTVVWKRLKDGRKSITRITELRVCNHRWEGEQVERARTCIKAWAHVGASCLATDRYWTAPDLFSERKLTALLRSKATTFEEFVRGWMAKDGLRQQYCFSREEVAESKRRERQRLAREARLA